MFLEGNIQRNWCTIVPKYLSNYISNKHYNFLYSSIRCLNGFLNTKKHEIEVVHLIYC